MKPEEWLTLKPGQTIYGKSNTPREILRVNHQGSNRMTITLKALRKTRFGPNTVYTKSECRNFFLQPQDKNLMDLQERMDQIELILQTILPDSGKLKLIRDIVAGKSEPCGDCGWPLDSEGRCYNLKRCIRTTINYYNKLLQ